MRKTGVLALQTQKQHHKERKCLIYRFGKHHKYIVIFRNSEKKTNKTPPNVSQENTEQYTKIQVNKKTGYKNTFLGKLQFIYPKVHLAIVEVYFPAIEDRMWF